LLCSNLRDDCMAAMVLAFSFLQVPSLLSAAALAAVMQTQPVAAAAAAGPLAVLSQLPLVAYTLQLYGGTWPVLTGLLHGKTPPTPAEPVASMATASASQQHHQQQQQHQSSEQRSTSARCAAAARELLGNGSILLQQLLKMAAAPAAAATCMQQQQLTAAIVYCADAVGHTFWLDARLHQGEGHADASSIHESAQLLSYSIGAPAPLQGQYRLMKQRYDTCWRQYRLLLQAVQWQYLLTLLAARAWRVAAAAAPSAAAAAAAAAATAGMSCHRPSPK
jgi:hypothetical protein